MSEQPDSTALSEEAEIIEQIVHWTIVQSISSYAAAMDSLMEDGKP